MKYGIQSKLVAFSLVTGIAMSGLIAGYALHRQQVEFMEDLQSRGKSMVVLLAETLVGPIYQLHIDEASKILAAATRDPEIVSVYAMDRNGLIISSGKENESELLLQDSPEELVPVLESIRKKPEIHIQTSAGQLLVTAPSQTVDGALVGFVHLRISMEHALSDLRSARIAMALIASLVLAMGGGVAVILARRFSSQVQTVLDGVRQIGQGRFEVLVPVTSADELGQLAQGINIMARELDRHRHHLEDLVRLRTAELVDARDAAEAANRAKSEFLASMSHELRTPLNAILGYSQLFGMDPDLGADTKAQAYEIEHAGQHLLSLINDLIDLARIESGKLEFSLEPVPVKQVLGDSLAMVAPIARKQGITLADAVCCCDVEQIAVRADFVRLRQVVINLLSNAIKYNLPQGKVTLSCHMEEGKVRISVSDTGPGIPADKQARIFNAFDRLGKETGTVEGTGIGLVITKRMVEAMGGGIGFASEEGRGSSFWVEFPVAEAAETACPVAPCSGNKQNGKTNEETEL